MTNMRTIVAMSTLLSAAVLATPTMAQTSCQSIGKQIFCSDGLSGSQIGQFTFWNDGTSSHRIGNTTFFSGEPRPYDYDGDFAD